MAFAGGPFNHFVLQSLRVLGGRLRDEPAELGLVTTVSGMLSKPGLAVWSATPPAGRGEPLLADLAAEATAATEVVPVVEVPPGATTPATVVVLHRHLRRRRRDSSRCARPSWPTCPMGSAPPPPAKMQGPPASPSPRASSGGRSR